MYCCVQPRYYHHAGSYLNNQLRRLHYEDSCRYEKDAEGFEALLAKPSPCFVLYISTPADVIIPPAYKLEEYFHRL